MPPFLNVKSVQIDGSVCDAGSAGWNFQFDSVDYRGFAQVPNKMTLAYQLISAEVYGDRGIALDQNIIRGLRNENFVTTVRNKRTLGLSPANKNPLDRITGILSALGKIKNAVDNLSSGGGMMGCSNLTQDVKIKIKSVIGVRNFLADITKPAVRLVVDSTDAAFKQNLHLSWRRCG